MRKKEFYFFGAGNCGKGAASALAQQPAPIGSGPRRLFPLAEPLRRRPPAHRCDWLLRVLGRFPPVGDKSDRLPAGASDPDRFAL